MTYHLGTVDRGQQASVLSLGLASVLGALALCLIVPAITFAAQGNDPVGDASPLIGRRILLALAGLIGYFCLTGISRSLIVDDGSVAATRKGWVLGWCGVLAFWFALLLLALTNYRWSWGWWL